MSQEFQRESRYAVFKFSKLNGPQSKILQEAMCRLPRVAECLVIESDWPEYEPVWQMIEARMTAAPVPPAGVICDEVAPITEQAWRSLELPPAGEVEVIERARKIELLREAFEQRFKLDIWPVIDWLRNAGLDDRAHVTRLTAENARLQAELKEVLHTSIKEDVFDVVCKERDALKAELAELADLKAYVTIPLRERCAQRLAMQSDLTKALELLNQWLNMFEGGLKSGDLDSLWNETADYVDPTINQSAPAAKREHILYRDGDSIGCIPESILDRNGQVALDMCTVCGKAEAELNGPCGGAPVAKGEPDA